MSQETNAQAPRKQREKGLFGLTINAGKQSVKTVTNVVDTAHTVSNILKTSVSIGAVIAIDELEHSALLSMGANTIEREQELTNAGIDADTQKAMLEKLRGGL